MCLLLMPKGFYFLITAQFASALADNALLILGIYFLKEQGFAAWWAPLLKFSLTLAYVLLACVVGPLSDAFPKSRLMAWMNALKMMGVVMLLMGAHPVSAFALIGLAASVYAPCKYGLVTETVPCQLLVRANAWLEVSVVLSVIFGIALGGALTGMVASGIASDGSAWVSIDSAWFVSTQTWPAMVLVMGIYFISALLNLGLRTLRNRSVIVPLTRRAIQWSTFWKSNQTLWRDPLGGVSLYVTTLYWGVGAVLQFAVLIWAEQSLGLSLKLGAYLQALVSLGVIVGAFLAGRYFKLHAARQAIPWGVLLAILLPVIVTVSNLWSAFPLLLLMGGAGGVLLVPMNALLQHRGMRVLSPGRSIAVQGFNENLCVLLMLAAYSALLAFSISLTFIMLLLALVLLAGMTPLCWMVIRRVRWRAEK